MAYKPKVSDQYAGNLNELKKRLAENRLTGTYVFFGDEEYLKTHYYDELLKRSGTSPLNVTSLFGTDFDLDEFVNACDIAPASDSLFAEETPEDSYRVVRLMSPNLDVLVRKSRKTDAEDGDNKDNNETESKKGDTLTKECEERFLPRIEDPDDGVIIVLWLYPGEDAKLNTRLYKRICESALVVCFKHEMPGGSTLVTWVKKHFTHAGIDISHDIASFFVTYVGNDMTTLAGAIDCCIHYLRYENRASLTENDVRTVCRQSLSAQIFDIANYAVKGNTARAMAAFRLFEADGEPALILFATIVRTVREICMTDSLARQGKTADEIEKITGIKAYFARGHIELLRARNAGGHDYAKTAAALCLEYDNKLKMGSKTDDYALLAELICKLAIGG